MRHFAWTAGLVLGLGLLSLPANAFVVVVGNSLGHDCFMAAKASVVGGNVDDGLATCTVALTDGGLTTHDRAATFINRGVLRHAKGLYDAAMEDYQDGINIMPDLGDAYVDRAAALIWMKRYDEAIVDVNKGIALGLSYPHLGYYNRAVAEELKGDFKASYFDFKKVLELEPTFQQATDQLKNFTVTTVKRPAT